jgi:hypothetical protein
VWKKERKDMLCELGKEKEEEVLGTHECQMYMMNIAKAACEH